MNNIDKPFFNCFKSEQCEKSVEINRRSLTDARFKINRVIYELICTSNSTKRNIWNVIEPDSFCECLVILKTLELIKSEKIQAIRSDPSAIRTLDRLQRVSELT